MHYNYCVAGMVPGATKDSDWLLPIRANRNRRDANCSLINRIVRLALTKGKIMEPRQIRGLEIAAKCKIRRMGFQYVVPSQTGNGKYYVSLEGENPRCTCPDHETRGVTCKHAYAVQYMLERKQNKDGSESVTETIEITESIKRTTYRQVWPAYNAAQTNEKHLFQSLLYDLCRGLQEPPRGKGRPRIRMSDGIFSAAFKVYSTVSGRRFMCDLKDATERGYLKRTPHYNSIFNVMEDERVTPVLHHLIGISGLPLKAVETDFAADSSGFSTSRFTRWYDHKYGGERKEHDWVKCHIMCGVKTNVVTAVEIAGRSANDARMFPPLLDKTTAKFNVEEVSGDMAYLSRSNVNKIADSGAVPYIPFKCNSVAHDDDPAIWQKMFHLFQFNRDEFAEHYHKRSNVESTFSMIKAKFRDHIRSKTDAAMVNEALCKFLCHNICCVIQKMFELGIDPAFWADSTVAQEVGLN